MRLLSFSDVYALESPIEKLQSIIETEKIDAIVLLGGLFPNFQNESKTQSKNSVRTKKQTDIQSTNILELNWLLIPIYVIPDKNDLNNKKLIRQFQGQEAVWIRYIHNKGTILDNWFIFSISDSDNEEDIKVLLKTVEEYSKVAPDRSILLYTGEYKIQFPNVHATLVSKITPNNNSNSFIVSVDSIKEREITIIDLDKKTVNSMLLE